MSNFFSLTERAANSFSRLHDGLNYLSSFQVICFLRRASENYTTESSTFSEELQCSESYAVKTEGKLENCILDAKRRTLMWSMHRFIACSGCLEIHS